MALSAARVLTFEGQPPKDSLKLTASDTYYRGAMIVRDGSTGYGKVPADAAALEIAGILTGKFEGGVTDYAHVVGSGENPRAEVEIGEVWLPLTGGTAAQTDVGDLVYAADDENLTKTAGSKTIAYRVKDYDAALGLKIDLRQPIKMS